MLSIHMLCIKPCTALKLWKVNNIFIVNLLKDNVILMCFSLFGVIYEWRLVRILGFLGQTPLMLSQTSLMSVKQLQTHPKDI